ncbi:hypothetical protein [Streptomyces niveus]
MHPRNELRGIDAATKVFSPSRASEYRLVALRLLGEFEQVHERADRTAPAQQRVAQLEQGIAA